jgi:hypothetical protein
MEGGVKRETDKSEEKGDTQGEREKICSGRGGNVSRH